MCTCMRKSTTRMYIYNCYLLYCISIFYLFKFINEMHIRDKLLEKKMALSIYVLCCILKLVVRNVNEIAAIIVEENIIHNQTLNILKVVLH